MNDSPILRVNTLDKYFENDLGEQIPILNNISFTLQKGQSIGLIGKNGSGKTTLLKILSQIIRPSAGQLELFGKHIAMIDVDGFFNQELSGESNTRFYLQLQGLTPSQIDRIIPAIQAFSGIGNYFNKPLKSYSKGMQIRLILSTILELDADLFIIDEVFFAGDREFLLHLVQRQKQMRENGVSFLIASHNLSELLEMTEECIWIEDHSIKMKDASSIVLKEYQNQINRKFSEDKILESQLAFDLFASNYVARFSDIPAHELENQWIQNLHIEINSRPQPTYFNGFSLQISYLQKDYTFQIFPGIHLLNFKNQSICISASINSHSIQEQKNNNSRQAQKSFTFQFPPQHLIQGRYLLKFIFFKEPANQIPHVEEAFQIEKTLLLEIFPDAQIVYGEDLYKCPINLYNCWKFS
ncbi:MAG: ATP-binding cassette domain-containing protein [Bacteroidia bacterium]|nr:ATP-binding cassette domain-containing protein [Bacteroidia bacterium]